MRPLQKPDKMLSQLNQQYILGGKKSCTQVLPHLSVCTYILLPFRRNTYCHIWNTKPRDVLEFIFVKARCLPPNNLHTSVDCLRVCRVTWINLGWLKLPGICCSGPDREHTSPARCMQHFAPLVIFRFHVSGHEIKTCHHTHTHTLTRAHVLAHTHTCLISTTV